MKNFSLILLGFLAAIDLALAGDKVQIKGRVRKRNSRNPYKTHSSTLPYCQFNTTVIENTDLLLKTIEESKFIFTGKVLNLRNAPRNSRLARKGVGSDKHIFKIFIRRVLKGDLNELGDVHFEPTHKKNFNGVTVYVARDKPIGENCMPSPRVRYSAIFLAEREMNDDDDDEDYEENRDANKEGLRLVVDPVPLSLYHLDRVNAAVKGINDGEYSW